MKRSTYKMVLTLLVVSVLSGCAAMEANKRAAKASVVRIAGMDMANSGALGPSYAILGENEVVLPTDQQYLMTLTPYMPQFLNIGYGSYRFAASSRLVGTDPESSTLQLKPLGFAKTNRLVMFFVVSANRSEEGEKVKGEVRTELIQSVNSSKPVINVQDDIISFSVADASTVSDDIDGWHQSVLLLEKAPSNAVDLGIVEVKPGKVIWSDYLEPYGRLKDIAEARGASVITDLELVTKKDQQGGLTANFGFRARAWKVEQSGS